MTPPTSNNGPSDYARYIAANHSDMFGRPKYKSFDEWKAAVIKDAEIAARQAKVDALKKAAMLGVNT